MRFALILLLAAPLAMSTSVKCYLGMGHDDNDVFKQGTCAEGTEYCLTQDMTLNGVRQLDKSCGTGLCKSEGCKKIPGGTDCCCKGDLCNGPAAPSTSTVSTPSPMSTPAVMATAAASQTITTSGTTDQSALLRFTLAVMIVMWG